MENRNKSHRKTQAQFQLKNNCLQLHNQKYDKIKSQIQLFTNFTKNQYSAYFKQFTTLFSLQENNEFYQSKRYENRNIFYEKEPINYLLQKYRKKYIPKVIKKCNKSNKYLQMPKTNTQNKKKCQKKLQIKCRSITANKNKLKEQRILQALDSCKQPQQSIQYKILRSRKQFQNQMKEKENIKNKRIAEQQEIQDKNLSRVFKLNRTTKGVNKNKTLSKQIQFKVLDQQVITNLYNIQTKCKKSKYKKKVSSLHEPAHQKLYLQQVQGSNFITNHFKKLKLKSQLSIPNQLLIQQQQSMIPTVLTDKSNLFNNSKNRIQNNFTNLCPKYQIDNKINKKISLSSFDQIRQRVPNHS